MFRECVCPCVTCEARAASETRNARVGSNSIFRLEKQSPKSVRVFYPREIALTQLQHPALDGIRISSPTMLIVSQLALHAIMLASPAAAVVPRASARVRTPLLSGAASGPPTDVVAYNAAGDVPFRVAYDANSELEEDKEYEVESLLFVGMVRTMRDEGVRGLLSAPVLLGLASGLLKITLTIALVFRFYMEHYNNMGHWGQLLSKCPTWHDACRTRICSSDAPSNLSSVLMPGRRTTQSRTVRLWAASSVLPMLAGVPRLYGCTPAR